MAVSEGSRLGVRAVCSILALASSWLLQGAYRAYNSWQFWHGIPVRDHFQMTWHDVRGWLFLTGFFCAIGWLVVGIPVVALGEKIFVRSTWTVVLGAGAAGAGIMLIPTLFWTVGVGEPASLLHAYSWVFCGIAFVIAALTMVFYKLYVRLAERMTAH